MASIACGKKGAPLPPLVRVPVPPADFTAERRGEEVKLQFTVPSANTDGTRPANVERLDIFRFTGPPAATDDDVLKLGTKVASVPVKAPANPDITTEADEPAEEPELKDEGLDQGAVAQLEDTIVPAALKAVVLPKKGRKAVNDTDAAGRRRCLGRLLRPASTTYVIVGINTKGRKGPLSRRVRVPLVPPPKPPPATTITYDETTITVTWTPSPSVVPIQAPATGDLLPGRTLGLETPTFSYHVYDVSPSAVAASPNGSSAQLAGQLRLTRTPIAETSYADSRIEWGSTRCYTVRTVETVGDLDARERRAGAGVPDAQGHVPAGRAQGSAAHRDRTGDQPDLGAEQRKRRGRLPRVARDVGGHARADHAGADHRHHVQRRGGRRDAVLVRGAGGRSRGQRQPAVESRRRIGALIE